jgi:iron(III) transport system ATP-binding protein
MLADWWKQDWWKRTKWPRWIGTGGDVRQPPRAPSGRAAAVFAAELTFDAVTCQFDNAAILNGVSLIIAPGEIVCLLGPSGSGKTTLLRIASGVERPTSGRVLINGEEVAARGVFVPPEKRSVGLMFQDFALFPHLTIEDNVAFGLRVLPRDEARQEARAVLARVGLERHALAFPHTLSGGEQQRVALARAILPRPAVMLMDEPFSGLDVQLREAMQDETLKLLRETRATCLMVTHSPDEAMRLGDRIAVMRGGYLIQVGTAEELYRNPADLFVARLFSEINEVAMTVTGGALRTPFGTFAEPNLTEGSAAVLCLRRRAFRFVGDQSADASRPVAGRVLRTRFLGDAIAMDLALQGFDQPVTMVAPETRARPRGAEVSVTIEPSGVLVFAAGS